jgi:dihydroflavonol-4-reductase
MNVLITGANGFLGTHLARKALERGWRVRGLCLPGTDTKILAELGAQIIEGDVTRPESLAGSCDDIEVVFHVAGTTLEWHIDPAVPYKINALGTRNICREAAKAGVRRLVHTASAATLGSKPPNRDLTDETVLWDLWDTGIYSRSKFLGEHEALAAGARGLDVVICCPHQILGEEDFGPSTPGRIVILFRQGKIPFYIDVVSQFVNVKDVAEGHLLAAEKGKRGERYILGGPELVNMKIFFTACAELTGRAAPKFAVPRWLVKLIAYPIEWWSNHVSHSYPLLTVGNGNVLYKDMASSIEKARRDLGYDPQDWRIALAEADRWFTDNGYYDRKV